MRVATPEANSSNVAQFAQTYGGGVVSVLLGGYAWLMRLALNQHLEGLRKLTAKVDVIGDGVSNLGERVARMEGRQVERDHHEYGGR